MSIPSTSTAVAQRILDRPQRSGVKAAPRAAAGRAGRFWWNVLSYTGANALGAALQLVLVTLLARCLNLEGFAAYVTAAAWIGIGEMASDFGTRVWAAQQFSLAQQPAAVMRRVLACKLGYSAAWAVVMAVMPIAGLDLGSRLLCLCIAFTQPNSDPLLWHLRGRERLDLEAVMVLAWRVGTVGLVASFGWAGYGLETLLVAWLGGNLARVAVELQLSATRSLWTAGDVPPPITLGQAMGLMRAVFPLGIAMVLLTLFHRLGVLSLGFLGRPQDVAAYGSAFTLAAPLGFIATAVAAASFPRLVQALGADEHAAAAAVLRTKFRLIGGLFALLCGAGIALGPIVLPWLFGDQLAAAGEILVLLMPALFISCINLGLKFVLNATGKHWSDVLSVLSGVIVFAATLPLARWIPPTAAAAIGWGGGELAIFLMRLSLLRGAMRCWRVPALSILSILTVLSLAAAARCIAL